MGIFVSFDFCAICYYEQFGKGYCSAHYIRYDVLYSYVLSRLQYWSKEARQDEEKLLQRLLKTGDRERNAAKKRVVFELKKEDAKMGRWFPLLEV
jgi:hypothetical protein